LQDKIQTRKLEQARLIERKEALEKERDNLNAQLKEQGINSEEELKKKINELEKDISDRIESAEKTLG